MMPRQAIRRSLPATLFTQVRGIGILRSWTSALRRSRKSASVRSAWPRGGALQAVVAANLPLVLGRHLLAGAQRRGVLDRVLVGGSPDGPAGVVHRADVHGDDARARAWDQPRQPPSHSHVLALGGLVDVGGVHRADLAAVGVD